MSETIEVLTELRSSWGRPPSAPAKLDGNMQGQQVEEETWVRKARHGAIRLLLDNTLYFEEVDWLGMWTARRATDEERKRQGSGMIHVAFSVRLLINGYLLVGGETHILLST